LQFSSSTEQLINAKPTLVVHNKLVKQAKHRLLFVLHSTESSLYFHESKVGRALRLESGQKQA
jgi:hypothetical protein